MSGRLSWLENLQFSLYDRKYYDLVLHFVELKSHVITGKIDVKLHSRVLLLNEHRGPESVENIHAKLDEALKSKLGWSFDELLKTFTLVTDWASTPPCIVGASASSNRVPLGVKWIGCVVQQLNTLLKHVMA